MLSAELNPVFESLHKTRSDTDESLGQKVCLSSSPAPILCTLCFFFLPPRGPVAHGKDDGMRALQMMQVESNMQKLANSVETVSLSLSKEVKRLNNEKADSVEVENQMRRKVLSFFCFLRSPSHSQPRFS